MFRDFFARARQFSNSIQQNQNSLKNDKTTEESATEKVVGNRLRNRMVFLDFVVVNKNLNGRALAGYFRTNLIYYIPDL